jgi:cell division protein ZapA
MSGPAQINITLTIGGRSHVIAAAPGEEAHLRKLAGMIDERVRNLGLAHNQTEARMLLIAGLVLADELHTLQSTTPAAAPPPPPAPVEPAPSTAPAEVDPTVHARIAALADRVEKLALRLEQSDIAP